MCVCVVLNRTLHQFQPCRETRPVTDWCPSHPWPADQSHAGGGSLTVAAVWSPPEISKKNKTNLIFDWRLNHSMLPNVCHHSIIWVSQNNYTAHSTLFMLVKRQSTPWNMFRIWYNCWDVVKSWLSGLGPRVDTSSRLQNQLSQNANHLGTHDILNKHHLGQHPAQSCRTTYGYWQAHHIHTTSDPAGIQTWCGCGRDRKSGSLLTLTLTLRSGSLLTLTLRSGSLLTLTLRSGSPCILPVGI